MKGAHLHLQTYEHIVLDDLSHISAAHSNGKCGIYRNCIIALH